MAKNCCCTSAIDAAANRVLAEVRSQGVRQAAVPPFQRTQQDTEEIARRVADEVNRRTNPFERDVQRQLDAIVNSLIALRSQEKDNSLLNRILRNQNDAFDLAIEHQRQTQFGIDGLATRQQARDLLNAIASLRRDMLEQFRFSAREISNRFAAVGAAIIALGAAQKAAFAAEIAAKTAQTALILRAIAGLKLTSPPGGGLAEILAQLAELAANKLSLEPITLSVPFCAPIPGGGFQIDSQVVSTYAIADGRGRSTAAFMDATAGMLYELLAFGQLQCDSSVSLAVEVLAEIDASQPGSDIPRELYPVDVSARFFTIQVTGINPRFVRAYKLAGDRSEYGLGNWSVVDSQGRVDGDFSRLFCLNHRLLVPTELSLPGVRVSLKPGVSVVVSAVGIPIR